MRRAPRRRRRRAPAGARPAPCRPAPPRDRAYGEGCASVGGVGTRCLRSAEAVSINTTASLALLRSVALRVGDRLAGRHPVLRQQEAWDLNAAFVRSLGLDPAMVLPSR